MRSQCIDASQPHIKYSVAKLVDRPSELVGDLTLLRNIKLPAVSLHLPESEERSNQDRKAAEALQQRRPSIVLELEPVISRLPSGLGRYLVQGGVRGSRHESLRSNQVQPEDKRHTKRHHNNPTA